LRDKCYFCDINNQKTLLYSFICNFLTLLGRSLLGENQKVVQEKPPDAGTILSAALNTKIKLLLTAFRSNTEFCNDFSDFTFEEYENFGFTGLNNAITQVFVQNGVPVDVPTVLPLLKELIYLILKSKDSYDFYSGLVFSGYGEDEIFPQLIPINVSIALGKRLKYHPDTGRSATITHKIQSAIRPFAQTDVIDTILAGIDPAMNELYAKQFEEFIIKHNNSISQLIEPLNSNLAGNIKNIDANALASTLRKLIAQERKKYYIDPLMNAVTTLSKEDLAEMAESLIYLTYLKRRFTLAAESVGGPVDVAIITKCDGFIWIKRKHYFKAELNYHFFKNH
jgi:hypothetical protein